MYNQQLVIQIPGPLARYVKSRVAHVPGMLGMFSPQPRVSDPDMHHGTCVTHVPWCMPGLLTGGFLWSRRRGKSSRYSRRMRNPQVLHIWQEAHGASAIWYKQNCKFCTINARICCRLTLQRRNNERDGVSKHQRLDCLLNRLLGRK